MKHRDRVLTALNHEVPDRCPMQISFTPEFADILAADLNQSREKSHNPHGGGNTYALERALDEDMLLTSVGWVNGYYAPGYQDVDSYVDEWGVTWQVVEYETRFGKGHYTEPFGHPLADDAAIERYTPPDPNRPALYADAARVLREFRDEYWIVGVVVTTVFEAAWALRGYEQLMVDFLLDPALANRILDLPYQYHLTVAKTLAEMGVDMIWFGDDVGAQDRMLLAPQTWRTFFKPRLAQLIAAVKQINPRLKVAYHTDGNVYDIVPELIEIGVDVLNPIQPASMDPVQLKQAFGERLCFWGSIDLQYTLPFGTPAQVRQEVLTRLDTLGKGGGLILGPTHNVQLDVPLENFWAMVNAIKTRYPAPSNI
jgi:uroporphyrinogen-III decarboxylase